MTVSFPYVLYQVYYYCCACHLLVCRYEWLALTQVQQLLNKYYPLQVLFCAVGGIDLGKTYFCGREVP